MGIRKWLKKKKEIQPPKPHQNIRPMHSYSSGTERLEYLEQKSQLFEKKMLFRTHTQETTPTHEVHRCSSHYQYQSYAPMFDQHLQSVQTLMMMQYMDQLNHR